jgi:hypothetical protein
MATLPAYFATPFDLSTHVKKRCVRGASQAQPEPEATQDKHTGYDRKHNSAGKCRLIHEGTSIDTLQGTDPKAACKESILDHNSCCSYNPIFALLAHGNYL